jgi:zinc ribbon protein
LAPCPNCQRDIPPGEYFCDYCGASISEIPKQAKARKGNKGAVLTFLGALCSFLGNVAYQDQPYRIIGLVVGVMGFSIFVRGLVFVAMRE